MEASPIERVQFRGKPFWLKRDDLLHPILNGNKARKLYWLLHAPLSIERVVSYGSLLSNAMYAIAYVAKMRGWSFRYYARFDDRLLSAPVGNLKRALELGMELRPIEELPLKEPSLLSQTIIDGKTLFIPEGGRSTEAQVGIERLAQEIEEWRKEREVCIFLPSGTGTTAFFLQKYLDVEVMTVACVGGSNYLRKQFRALGTSRQPTVLEPPKRYRFGRLYRELYQLWRELLEETGVEFDLLYDPVGFATLLHHNLLDEKLLYIHQGGLGGNETMIARYKAKFGKIAKTS